MLSHTQLADNSKDNYESKILACGLEVNPYAIKTGPSLQSFRRQSTGAIWCCIIVGRLYKYRDERGFPLTQYTTNG